MRARLLILTTGPWDAGDGNPARPDAVLGIPVAVRLRSRSDAPGALVRLADRRYALTGPTVAVGSARQLRRYLRRLPARSRAQRESLTELERTLEAGTGAAE